MEVKERDVEIVNKLGLHARPASKFVETAKKFECTVRVFRNEQSVDGKNIMDMMLLAATAGTQLRIQASGPDADSALEALAQLVSERFGEDD